MTSSRSASSRRRCRPASVIQETALMDDLGIGRTPIVRRSSCWRPKSWSAWRRGEACSSPASTSPTWPRSRRFARCSTHCACELATERILPAELAELRDIVAEAEHGRRAAGMPGGCCAWTAVPPRSRPGHAQRVSGRRDGQALQSISAHLVLLPRPHRRRRPGLRRTGRNRGSHAEMATSPGPSKRWSGTSRTLATR